MFKNKPWKVVDVPGHANETRCMSASEASPLPPQATHRCKKRPRRRGAVFRILGWWFTRIEIMSFFHLKNPLVFFLPTCTCHWNKSQCQQEPQLICAFISSSYIIAYSEVSSGNISHPQYFTLENKKKSKFAGRVLLQSHSQQAYKRAQPSGHCNYVSLAFHRKLGTYWLQKVARSGQKIAFRFL